MTFGTVKTGKEQQFDANKPASLIFNLEISCQQISKKEKKQSISQRTSLMDPRRHRYKNKANDVSKESIEKNRKVFRMSYLTRKDNFGLSEQLGEEGFQIVRSLFLNTRG